jgi:arylsulfatase A-like enzyme
MEAVAADKGGAKSTGRRPNIVLIMSDDQGWGETSYNGHPHLKTPVLDEMASSGLRLDRFYAASPVCSPTRASVITGRHANRSGAFGAGWSIRPEEVTLAPLLKAAGYRTAHFGKWHVGAIKEGSPLSPNGLGFDESLSHDNFFEMNPELSRNGKPAERIEGEGSEVIVKESLRFARKVHGEDKPFFIVIWFGSPHSPYSSPEKDSAPYEKLGKELSWRFGEITAMDRAIGMFRQGLDAIEERNNTLLWFNSDNGMTIQGIPEDQRKHQYNGHLRGHKATMYEGGLLVPGIIEWPTVIKEPRSSPVPCVTSDILPTLLDILEITHPKAERPLDGISLKELVVEGTMQNRPAPIGFSGYDWKSEQKNERWLADNSLNEKITRTAAKDGKMRALSNKKSYFKNHKHPVAKTQHNGSMAWIDNRYKLVLPKRKNARRYELYDLENDREESVDIASKHPEIVKTMRAELLAWQESVGRSLTGADY